MLAWVEEASHAACPAPEFAGEDRGYRASASTATVLGKV
jgi:hypothetical protein